MMVLSKISYQETKVVLDKACSFIFHIGYFEAISFWYSEALKNTILVYKNHTIYFKIK